MCLDSSLLPAEDMLDEVVAAENADHHGHLQNVEPEVLMAASACVVVCFRHVVS